VREIEVLADAQVALLADRRRFRPYGLQGGSEGAAGHAPLSSMPEATWKWSCPAVQPRRFSRKRAAD
jgi:N-methylhydantoinase B/oxoprolinase/acetone carboxylase alpha subunit